MDTAHGGYGTSQMPLAGAILCCTSIPPEQRAELAAIGAQMGATIKLDLTSDVTHLVVGNIHSAKYRYVAKSREDVKVLLPGWLDALRTVWMEGDDVDVAALEEKYKLPTFYGLKICLTGFDSPEQRKFIQDTVVHNGAEYHGDLTKAVTHLIAATASGKKYEHAVNWRMKIVTWEWFAQSRERGMALDELCYHPTMPVEERGRGAWDRRKSTSPTLGKRTRDDQPEPLQLSNPLRRKLRRSASSRMGTQSEALWAGITAAGLERKKDEEDDWTDNSIAKPELPAANAPTTEATEVTHDDAQAPEDPAFRRRRGPFADEREGIFEGRLVMAHGFDRSKTRILQEHLDGNAATVIREPSELNSYTSEELRQGFLVIPHDVEVGLASLPEGAGELCLVTNWWVERCLHGKCLVDPADNVLCRPFDKLSISGFNGLIVNSTGFTGIELLHMTKVIALMGATYDELLSGRTSVMICNSRKPNPDKIEFTTDKHIPAVHATWLWECILRGERQPYDGFLLNAIAPQPQKPKEKPKASFNEVPTAPLSEEDSFKLRQMKAQSSKNKSKPCGPRRPKTLDLVATPISTTGSSATPHTSADEFRIEQDAQITGFDGAGSLPLQDINPSVNSPRRPSTSSTGSTTQPNTKNDSTRSNSMDPPPVTHAPAPRKSRLAREPTPDSVIPADSLVPPDTETPVQDPKSAQPDKDYEGMLTKYLAKTKANPNAPSDSNPQAQRKRRPLGRAQSGRSNPSNPSTADDVIPRHSSLNEEVKTEKEDERRVFEEYQASQELGWDSPGAQKAREKMIRAMGGKVEEGRNVLEGVGVVKDAVSDVPLARARGKRRG